MISWMKTVTAFSATLMLAACASAPTGLHQNDPSHSLAWNIATAGGIAPVQDTDVPAEQRALFTETGLYTGVSIARTLTDPVMGGLQMFADALGPREKHRRPSIIAWMPKDLAPTPENAQANFEQIVIDAMDKGFKEEGVSYVFSHIKSGDYRYHFFGPDLDCPKREPETARRLDMTCRIEITGDVRGGQKLINTTFPVTGERYFFHASHPDFYPKFEIYSGSAKNLPTQRLYTAISRNLPDWVYMYFGSGNTNDDDGNPINIPYVMNQGNLYYFVSP